jgi:hypothetical protein
LLQLRQVDSRRLFRHNGRHFMRARLLWWLALATVFVSVARGVDLPRFWVFTAIWCGFALYASLAADPTLLKERLKPAAPTVDRGALRAIRVLALASIATAVLDIDRYHWSDTVVPAIRMPAMVVFATSMALAVRAMVVNKFFSTAVRLQTDRGHRVVSAGPYRIIRHPQDKRDPWRRSPLGRLSECPVRRRAGFVATFRAGR